MPFQPTYPYPYNIGMTISPEEESNFECTVDEYDTIENAEFFIKDVSTNREIVRIQRESFNDYGKIGGIELSDTVLGGLANGEYNIRFENPNIPYVYEVSLNAPAEGQSWSKDNVSLSSKTIQTQYYLYDAEQKTYSPIPDTTYTEAAYIVWGPFNSFKGSYDMWGNSSTQGDDDSFFSKKLDVTFASGSIDVDSLKLQIYNNLFNDGHSPTSLRDTCKSISGYIYILPPYSLLGIYETNNLNISYDQKQIWPRSRYYDSYKAPYYSAISLLLTPPGNSPTIAGAFTDLTYREYKSSKNTVIYGDFTEKKIRTILPMSGNSIIGLGSINNFPASKPIGGNGNFFCPLTIGYGLISRSGSTGEFTGEVALVNPGMGYTPSDVSISFKRLDGGSRTQTTGYSVNKKGNITSINPIGSLVNFGSVNLNSNIYGSYQSLGLFPSLPVYVTPPSRPTGKLRVYVEDEVKKYEFTLNTGDKLSYLIPPKIQYQASGGAAWYSLTGTTILIKDNYEYSIDGGKTYESVSSDSDETPFEFSDFPIIGGKGEESRLFINIDFYKMGLPQDVLDKLTYSRLSWYFRLVGAKDDVYIYSGDNFKKKEQGGLTYAILPNNSNIAEGAKIYKNYKDVYMYSDLIDIENQFAGLNISAVGSGITGYKFDLREPIQIPYSPYMLAGGSNIYDGMACLVNGLEYDVKEFTFDSNGDIVSIEIEPNSSSGETINPDVIMENMRVEVYRNNCIAQLGNSDFTLQDYESYTIWSNSLLTQQYYFETNRGQEASIIPNIEGEEGVVGDISCQIFDSCNLTFSGSYTGDVLYHKWELYESIDEGTIFNLIKDTGEVYSTDLTIEYKGLNEYLNRYTQTVDNKSLYKLKLIVSNNLSQIVEAEQYFYIENQINTSLSTESEIDCNRMAAKIDLSEFSSEDISIVIDDLFNMDTLANLISDLIIYKRNVITDKQEEIVISKDNKLFYDYALANYGDYIYKIRGVYEMGIGSNRYGYIDSEDTIIFTSSGKDWEEVADNNSFVINKYNWSKLLIIDTQKRLSEPTEGGQYFISTDPDSKWDFQLGIEDSDISITTDSGVYDGLYEFPIVNETYRNYKTQSLSCKLGKIDDSTEWRYGRSSVDIVNKWKKFCNNGHVKILRDRFGNLVPVKVTAKSYKCNNTKPMIIDLAFDWTQLASEEGLFAVELSQGEVNT